MPREPTDDDLHQLLDTAETPEEKRVLDRLARDPEDLLRRVKERLALRLGRRPVPPPDEPPKP